MDPKALFTAILVLAILVQLAPTVYSCVNVFVAQGESDWVYQPTWLDGKLWDNPDSSGHPRCTLASGGPIYNFACDPGYFATLDINANTVSYTNSGGPLTFDVTYTSCGNPYQPCSTYQACRYECALGDQSCFAYGCAQNNYNGCRPP